MHYLMKRGSVFQKDREQELRRRRHGRHDHRSDPWCIDRCRPPRSRPPGARENSDPGVPIATLAPDVSLRCRGEEGDGGPHVRAVRRAGDPAPAGGRSFAASRRHRQCHDCRYQPATVRLIRFVRAPQAPLRVQKTLSFGRRSKNLARKERRRLK